MSDLSPPRHELNSHSVTIRGNSDFVLQIHQTPRTPAVPACLWDRGLHDAAANWFAAFRSAGAELGLGFVLMTPSKLLARFQVTVLHSQPSGLLHGGISALVAEEMGSIASAFNASPNPVVGINVVATHLASAKIGDIIMAQATPIKRQGKLQVWSIDLYLDDDPIDVLTQRGVSLKVPKTGGEVDSAALYYSTWQPKGTLLATCQLTTMARKPSEDAKTHFPAVKSKL